MWAEAHFQSVLLRMRAVLLRQLARLLPAWQRLSLDRQFIVAAAVVILLGMACIGVWVTDRIKTGVVNDSAYEARLQMDRIVAPLVQELAGGDRLTPESIAKLDRVLETWIGRRIYSIKIWRRDGFVAYSNWHDQIGRSFRMTPNFLKALSGAVAADIENHSHEPDGHEQRASVPLIEIYAPVLSERTGEVIAVAEFYAMAQTLNSQLWWSVASSWLVVGIIGVLMTGALYGIVWRGRLTIDDQSQRLQVQIGQLRGLLEENDSLQERLRLAYKRSALINEQFLRRVSADLHDGPAQLLSLGLLQLHRLEKLAGSGEGAADGGRCDQLVKIERALREALQEVRDISAGLSLPDLVAEPLEGCIRRVVRAHEERTGTQVDCILETLPRSTPLTVKTCVYRVLQEALNNCYKHAGGVGQHVSASIEAALLSVVVSDKGGGMPTARPIAARTGTQLGLSGLRDRVETLGGELRITSSPATGTRLEAKLDLAMIGRMEAVHG